MRIAKEWAIPAVGGMLLAAAMGWGAYRQGLFYDADLYRWESWIILTAIFAAIWSVYRGIRIPLAAWTPFALAAAYGIAWLAGPASVKGTIDSILRWCSYGAWAVILGVYLADPKRRITGSVAFYAAGACLILGVLAGWYGWFSYESLIFRSGDAALSANGARLAGFLQYPNAYGAVVAMFSLALWQLLDSADRRVVWAGANLAVPTVVSLLLTESRGAMLALAVGAVFSLLARPAAKRGYALAAGGIIIGLASLAARASFDAMAAGTPAIGVYTLIPATLMGGLVLMGLRKMQPRTESDEVRMTAAPSGESRWMGFGRGIAARLTSLGGGAAILALGLALAYGLLIGGDSGGARAEGHLETASARGLYYEDALRMFMDRPVTGAGGETWRMQVGLYQQKPYIGNEVHSGYLEVLIDTGLLGAAALAVMILMYIIQLKRSGLRGRYAWGPATVLVAHAVVDFDWSYAYVWMLLLYWLALHQSDEGTQAAEAPNRGLPAGKRRLMHMLPALGLLLLAVIIVPASWRYAAAVTKYEAAQEPRGNASRLALLREALTDNPAWNRVRLDMAPLLPALDRVQLLQEGLRYEPYSPAIEYELGMAYAELGDPILAELSLREAVRLDRFNREGQNAVIARMARLNERLTNEGNNSQARIAAEAGIGFFERYRSLYADLYAKGNNPWYGTELFASAKINAAQCYLALGRSESAVPILREVAAENKGEWQEQANQLLASIKS